MIPGKTYRIVIGAHPGAEHRFELKWPEVVAAIRAEGTAAFVETTTEPEGPSIDGALLHWRKTRLRYGFEAFTQAEERLLELEFLVAFSLASEGYLGYGKAFPDLTDN